MSRAVLVALTAALSMLASGCIPIVRGKGYEGASRHNVPAAVPAFIQPGQASMADVVLALGEPDTVAVDERWMTFVSRYGEGGSGMVLIAAGGGSAGAVGGVREQVLYRRLLLRFDAGGIVTSAVLDATRCANTDTIFAQGSYASPECFDVASRDLTVGDLSARLTAAGETNLVFFDNAVWLPTHEHGVIALADAALYFVPDQVAGKPAAAEVRIALADVERVDTDQHAFRGGDAGIYKVVLIRGEEWLGSFVLPGRGGEIIKRGNAAKKKIRARLKALRR